MQSHTHSLKVLSWPRDHTVVLKISVLFLPRVKQAQRRSLFLQEPYDLGA